MLEIAFGNRSRGGLFASLPRPPVQLLFGYPKDGFAGWSKSPLATGPGAGCSQRSQARPFNSFLTIRRMVKIAFGDRSRGGPCRPANTFSSIHRMLEIATQPVFAPSSVISPDGRNATFSTRSAGAKEGRSGRPQALHCAQAVNARRPPGFSPLLRGGEAVSFAD